MKEEEHTTRDISSRRMISFLYIELNKTVRRIGYHTKSDITAMTTIPTLMSRTSDSIEDRD